MAIIIIIVVVAVVVVEINPLKYTPTISVHKKLIHLNIVSLR